MAKELLLDDSHVMGLSDASWLRDEGLQEQLDDDSYAIDNIGAYPLDDASYLPKNDCFYPDLPFSLKDAVPNCLLTAAHKDITHFGPLEVPLSMHSSLNPSLVSNSYDNRDFDVTEPSIRGQPSMISVDGESSNTSAPKHRHRLGPSTSSPVPYLNGRLRMVSSDQHELITEPQGHAIAQKRKRPIGNVIGDEINNSLIDRESALKLCIKHIPDPTIGVIDSIAQDFGFPFEFVMDLCRRYRKNRNSNPLGLDNVETAQHSALIYGLSDGLTPPIGKDSASTTGIEDLASTSVAAKRSKLYTEARQVAENEPQTNSHPCSNCAQTFSRHADLRRHRRTHFPPQIHCPYPGCNKSFTRKDKLNEHWRRKHSGDISEFGIIWRGQDEWGKDPDSDGSKGADNFFGGDSNGQGGSPFQNSQNAATSASQGWSSGASFSFAADVVEVHPVPTNQAMEDYPRKFIQKLGRGCFGSVYGISISTGSDANHCEIFACKTISIPKRGCEEVIERARNEISIFQLLDHSQIIKFSGAFILRDRIFINSQPLADSDLKVFLAGQSPPIQSTHMDLIKGMLLPDPGDRPSAAEVVNRLEIMESMTVDAVDRQGIQPLLLAWKTEQPSSTRPQQGFNKRGETASKASERKECREFSPQLPSQMVSAKKIEACKECRARKVKVGPVVIFQSVLYLCSKLWC